MKVLGCVLPEFMPYTLSFRRLSTTVLLLGAVMQLFFKLMAYGQLSTMVPLTHPSGLSPVAGALDFLLWLNVRDSAVMSYILGFCL